MFGLGGATTMWASALAGGAVLFIAGGQIIGGYKANQVRKEYVQVQATIVQNAIAQAEELAAQWEAENEKARRLQRRVERLQGELATAEIVISEETQRRETEIERAAENLATCLLNENTREILNNWMLGNDFEGSPTS